MAIIITTKYPQTVCDLFAQDVNYRNITTWIVDADGDFTIANPKWTNKAWMRPIIPHEGNTLVFGFVSSRKHDITKGLYGIYHGRLVATLIAHYDNLIDSVTIKPLLDPQTDIY